MIAHVLPFRAPHSSARRRSFRGSVSALLARLSKAAAESGRLSREHRYLAEMDDRMLRDIGLTRADIDAELREPANRVAPFFFGE